MKTIAAAVDSNQPPTKPLARRNDGPAPASGGRPRGAAGESGQRPPRRDNMERRNNERNERRPEGEHPPHRENRGARGDGNRPRFPRDGNREGGPRGGIRREFDRHSGDVRSGVKPVDKRGGRGAHNWGSATDTTVHEQGDLDQSGPNGNSSVNQDSSREETAEGSYSVEKVKATKQNSVEVNREKTEESKMSVILGY